jgi:hypothetical protein
MGLVDAKYRFVWASVGFPGNTHDAMILQATQLLKDIHENDIIPLISRRLLLWQILHSLLHHES